MYLRGQLSEKKAIYSATLHYSIFFLSEEVMYTIELPIRLQICQVPYNIHREDERLHFDTK